MTFHSPTGRNNQKGQNANTGLLSFSSFTLLLPDSSKASLVLRSPFFSSTSFLLNLSETSPPFFAAYFFPGHSPGVSLLFFPAVKSQLLVTLCLSFTFPTACCTASLCDTHWLPHLISPCAFFPHCLTISFQFVFSPPSLLRVLRRKHSAFHGDLKSFFF